MKISGEGTYVDAAGMFHKFIGECIIPDDIILQSLKVSGKLKFDSIICDKINVNGKVDGDSLTAKNFSVDGKVKIDSLKVSETFSLDGKPKIGNVTADEIIIDSRDGSIDNVKCRRLQIAGGCNIKIGGVLQLKFNDSDSRIKIKTINTETAALENCEVDIIRCKDAVIGTNCAIEKLFVAGEYKISADSTIGEIYSGSD